MSSTSFILNNELTPAFSSNYQKHGKCFSPQIVLSVNGHISSSAATSSFVVTLLQSLLTYAFSFLNTHETSGAPKRFSMNFPVSLEVSPISVSTPLNNRYLSLKHDVIHHTHSCNYNTKRKIISGSILKGLLMSHILWPLCCCLFVPCYIKQNLKKKNQHQLSVLTSPFLIKLFQHLFPNRCTIIPFTLNVLLIFSQLHKQLRKWYTASSRKTGLVTDVMNFIS